VELVLLLEALLLALGEHRVRQRQGVLGRELLVVARIGELAVDAELGTLPGRDMQVGCVARQHLLEQRTEVQAHAAVSLTTSSRVVIPFSSFLIPSILSVSIPSDTARSRSSVVEPPTRIILRTAGDIAITS